LKASQALFVFRRYATVAPKTAKQQRRGRMRVVRGSKFVLNYASVESIYADPALLGANSVARAI
jgi:hypothetical protein